MRVVDRVGAASLKEATKDHVDLVCNLSQVLLINIVPTYRPFGSRGVRRLLSCVCTVHLLPWSMGDLRLDFQQAKNYILTNGRRINHIV